MKLTMRLEQDQDAQSPQEDSDLGLFIIANHRDFNVPAPGNERVDSDPDVEKSPFTETHWIFPLEAYIHSGVVLAFGREGNFPDRQWDVSQVGWVFAAKNEWRLSASARKAAANYIETWNQYLSSDVWGYVIEDEDGNTVESCWGFYGAKYAKEEGESALKHAQAAAEEEAAEVHEMNCRDLVTA